ncbi:hypothetical protein ACQ4PT_005076 [Festuca glaucescens]
MDKTWLSQPRHTNEYVQGVGKFIDFAFGYHTWLFHGESSHPVLNPEDVQVENSAAYNEFSDLMRDLAYGLDEGGDLEDNSESNNNSEVDFNADAQAYLKMVDDDNKELYPGCKNFSKLRFIVRLLHIKLLGRWSDKSFDMVLQLLSDAFPEGSVVPKNFNEAKKIVKCVGLGDMQNLEAEIAETLSILETIFVPSFFDVMVHLMVNLPAQVRIAGPVHFRSMWCVERILGKSKGYVRTRSHPEGSIAEGYLFDECLTFCSRYLKRCETRFTRQTQNVDVVENEMSSTTPYFCSKGRAIGSASIVSLDHTYWLQAHRYVLFNHAEIQPYVDKHLEHLSLIGLPNQKASDNMHYEKFHEWFREHVLALVERGVQISEEIQILAQEPFRIGRKYNSYTAKGFHFHTHSSDEGRPIQNSGVALAAESAGVIKMYYGIIREIVELDYQHKGNMVLFRCDWVDNRVEDKWVKTDQFGVTIVNLNHLFSSGDKLSDEPFILASQATQVYYVPEANDKGWCAVVQNKKPHDTYSMAAMDDENIEDGLDNEGLLVDLHTGVDPNIDYANFSHIRTDIDGIMVAAPKKRQEQKWQQQQETQKTSLSEEREVRKITTMKSIWGRQNKPKLKLEVNEIGQPCGNSATWFANFIGTQIRIKGFPLAFDDWGKVDLPLKLGLWTQAKLFWDIDQGSFEWYMKTAQTKWREFKADLKKDWYDESMEYHELISSCDDRVHPDQWKWLVDHWLTPEAKARSIRGKANQAKHTQNHTAGSKSFAHVDTEMVCNYTTFIVDLFILFLVNLFTLLHRPRSSSVAHVETKCLSGHTHIKGVPQKGSASTINTRTPEDFNEGANNSGNHILEDEAESNGSMQVVNRNEDHPGRRIANVEKQPNRQQGGGRDVVVYSMARPFNVPVAKGTIQTTDPKAMVGGEPLGDQYVEIVIHSVFKRGTLLPCPYGDVVTMRDACGKSIAWPAAMVRTYNTYVVFLCVD